MKPSVLICIPAYTAQVDCDCMVSVIRNIKYLENNGYEVGLHIESGSCYLPIARNRCVAAFVESKENYSHLMFVDSDLKFQDDTIFKLAKRDLDIVAAVYPFRTGTYGWAFEPVTIGGLIPKRTDMLVEAVYLPTGLMCIKKRVFEMMTAAYPEAKKADGTNMLFDTGDLLGDGKWYGEDVLFCKRWTAIGGKCFVEPSISLQHIGRHAVIGNYLEFLMGLK